MIDLKLDATGDLDLQRNDLLWIDGAERVHQQLQIKLKLWKGEWFLNTQFGTPYLQQILGKQITLNGALAALKNSINEVDGVLEIEQFNYDFDRQTRQLSVQFAVKTPYGLVKYKGNQ
ncbi:hypothetical protein [Pragia fontium]|uniref:DUF2634 domain-containing protein n=1 Tax=Pragia fontium DSM 5563 = ATCC 49100 TaxID=1122977 RepID=A0AAJ5BFN1_9GAMM|nr:hypothetical protein [Pragia fontium]AKJ41496.1 hypothetical protein QQ39_04865 [Pragia fontium]SFB97110.1 hypothetical protein SAMN02745723_10161 [Pragia fontium DSM 5563 = ATCC 49100]SUB81749.1 Uncharacterised protein [Pragia fontium]SUC81298.1 Uncharacterised protein [Pragia fontium]VEJ54291.1 Uncharacterised protein [Pragia fontium]